MKKSKFIFLIVGVMLVAFVFASCGGGGGGTKETVWTVTFDSNGGSPITSKQVVDGQKVANPGAPTWAGDGTSYFKGWYTYDILGLEYRFNFEETAIIANITIKAEWSESEYTITFNSDGGTPVAAQEKGSGGGVDPVPDPTKARYGFEGWYYDGRLWDFYLDEVDNDMNLVAKWVQYEVGDTGPSGGTIYYVAKDAANTYPEDDDLGFTVYGYEGVFAEYQAWYLEVAPENINQNSRVQWGPNNVNSGVANVTTGGGAATNTPIAAITNTFGYGRQNTQTIIKSTTSTTAASLAANYSGGGKSDWFLPSLGECQQLYQNGFSGGNFATPYWWSSTQNSNTYAWYFNLSGTAVYYGWKDPAPKTNTNYVRAIRAF